MKLFEGDDDNANIDVSKIEIDEKFARRYEHNKKREDLQRYEELKKKGQIEDSESESESDSESDEVELKKLNEKKDFKEFIDNLIKVKQRDPSIYQKDVKLFESDSGSDDSELENEVRSSKNKKKAVYLKDVTAQHLIEEGAEFDEEEEGERNNTRIENKTYNEEQEELKKSFLEAVKADEGNDVDSEGGLLKVKEKKKGDLGEENDVELEDKLRKYFGDEEELDENNKFLKDFIEKQMWIDGDSKSRRGVDDDEVDDLLKDDEEIEKQELYEESYNFRHEENPGDRVLGHSRVVEGSVRKKENSRKEQRKRKKERMEIAEMERKEELKHLKNLKKKEMKEKLMKIVQVAGVDDHDDFGLGLDDLKKDFDPEEYDKMMKKAFGEKYYNTDDVNAEFGSDNDDGDEKPDFDKEDELLGLPKGWDGVDNEGFLALRERLLKQKNENGSGIGGNEEEKEEEEDDDDEEEEEEDGEEEEKEGKTRRDRESKRKRKRKKSLLQEVKEEWLEEYYKLDYEGTVGDLKTRFKYARVQPEKFGLDTAEIFTLDDQELNQYVSVKKLAPYRESEWKVNKYKERQFKEKLRELREGKSDDQKNRKKNKLQDNGDKSTSERQFKEKIKETRLGKSNNQKIRKKNKLQDNGDKSTLDGGSHQDEKEKVDSHQDEKEKVEVSNVEMNNLSRKAKRKRNQAEYKLSQSRMEAYQNIQSKAKGKRKL